MPPSDKQAELACASTLGEMACGSWGEGGCVVGGDYLRSKDNEKDKDGLIINTRYIPTRAES